MRNFLISFFLKNREGEKKPPPIEKTHVVENKSFQRWYFPLALRHASTINHMLTHSQPHSLEGERKLPDEKSCSSSARICCVLVCGKLEIDVAGVIPVEFFKGQKKKRKYRVKRMEKKI